MRKIIPVFILLIMAALSALPLTANTQAKVCISKNKLTLEVADKYALKLKGAKGRVVWKSSKPKVAKVNKKGKVTALKKGKTTITARMGKRKYKCVISVYNNTKRNENPIKEPQASDMPIPVTTQTPTQTPTQIPTPTPTPTQAPSYSVFSHYYVSDIGENYIEISDEKDQIIHRFEYALPPLKIMRDGGITINTPPNSFSIEGNIIKYSDIHVDDMVSIVYSYYEDESGLPLADSIKCEAINVWTILHPCLDSYGVFSQCYVSDIGKNYIEISDEANRLIYYFEYDCAPSRIIYDGKVTMPDEKSYNIEGESINYSDIHVGDKVDIVYCYSEYSELSDIYCDAINVYKR